MKKFFTSILALCAAAVLFPAGARERSVSEAQKVADNFKSGPITRSANPTKLAYTSVSQSQGVPCFYVFNREEGGFVIVTADTDLPEIIGYSAEGSFDYELLPPSMKWWLSQYEKEISAVYDGLATPAKKIATRAGNYANIDPLVQTKWDQGAPYNDQCPDKGSVRTWTGCVATSTSQILNYHKYFKGSGSHTDYFDAGLTVDYSTLSFNWDLMRNVYSTGDKGPQAGTAEQRAEVAKLMKAVGVAIDMKYGDSSDGGSGAYHQMVPYALQTYFGIAETATFVSRSWFDDTEWYDLVYSELKAGRPMVYGGAGKGTAHSFICDGYDVNGYFHINWGWGGSYDGWFPLTCLEPAGIGAGGGAGVFTEDQQAVIGIQPKKDGQQPWVIVEGYGESANATVSFDKTDGDVDMFNIDIYDSQYGWQCRGNIGQTWPVARTFDFQGVVYSGEEKVGTADFYVYNYDTQAWDVNEKTLPATWCFTGTQASGGTQAFMVYSIWYFGYKVPTLPAGKYTIKTEYKLRGGDEGWHSVYWTQNIDGTIYFTVDETGKRTYLTREEFAALDDEVLVEDLSLVTDNNRHKVAVGQTTKMSDICDVVFTPADATDKTLVWQSWGTDILEVSADGETVVGKADGTVRVTASTPDGKITAEMQVIVGTGIITGVAEIESGAEAVSVDARDGVITLSNVPEGAQINVYSVAGVHVASVSGTGTVEVNVGNSGIYVVTVGDKRFKVRL